MKFVWMPLAGRNTSPYPSGILDLSISPLKLFQAPLASSAVLASTSPVLPFRITEYSASLTALLLAAPMDGKPGLRKQESPRGRELGDHVRFDAAAARSARSR